MPATFNAYRLQDKDQQLLTATETGNLCRVKQLVSSGVRLDALLHSTARRESTNLLGNAAYHGQTEIVQYLLEAGAKIHYQDPVLSRNALHWACIGGREATVRILIQHDVNIDAPDRDHVTPLMHAVLYGHYDVSKILIEAGCDVMVSDRLDCSSLHYSCFKGLSNITELLIKNGCIANQASALETPLSNLVSNRDVANILLLIEAGYDVSRDSGVKTQLNLFPHDDVLFGIITQERQNVAPLMRLCRTKIRDILRKRRSHQGIKYLPLPKSIKLYLCLENMI